MNAVSNQDQYSKLNQYYGRTGIIADIQAAIDTLRRQKDALRDTDLAAFDQIHIGGRKATLDMIADLPPTVGHQPRILDAGCGLGGSARLLSQKLTAQVIGLDITHAYCHGAALLSQAVGLDPYTHFCRATVQHLPFSNHAFNMVISQHVCMNIENKSHMLAEFRRVLTPGGCLLLHEIVAGAQAPPHYPTPWAADASMSFLVSAETLRDSVQTAGFLPHHWQDITAPALAWWDRLLNGAPTAAPRAQPTGAQVVFGAMSDQVRDNIVRNLRQQRIQIIQAAFTAP